MSCDDEPEFVFLLEEVKDQLLLIVIADELAPLVGFEIECAQGKVLEKIPSIIMFIPYAMFIQKLNEPKLRLGI